jgi:predicted lipoprotein with Yx(FWY)xxD motif
MISSVPKPRLAMPGALAAILVLVAAALGAAPVLAGGSYGYGGASPAIPAGAPTSVQIGTTSTVALGVVLTGPNGMTLYTLSSDPNNGSVCTGQCLTFWPPLLVASGGTVAGPSGSSLTLSSFTRADDGTVQVTADGRALYYFAKDTAAGQTNGEGIKGAGGVWHVAGSAATSVAATTAPASAAPAVAAGGGYGAAAATPAAPSSTTQAPASSGVSLPIWLAALALVLLVVAFVAVRRKRPAGNR